MTHMLNNNVTLSGHGLTPKALTDIANGSTVALDEKALARMNQSRKAIDQAVLSGQPVYGVTTGLGPRVVDAMPDHSLDAFSLNTIRGRAHGVGEALNHDWVRAGMAVRVNTLLLGASGARPALAEHLTACLNAGLTPIIPESGTIGVADLCWGGALGLAMIGEGSMRLPNGDIVSADKALAQAKIEPFKPKPREGLALVSHSSLTAGLAALGWMQLLQCYEAAQTSAAMSMEAFRANLSPLDERVLSIRPQPGQSQAADGLRKRLRGSALTKSGTARRLQDPLSIRNVGQVHGSTKATLDFAFDALNNEINGASDNPAVLMDSGEILSNGGYLPVHISVSFNALTQSLVHLAALQVSRISKQLFERFSGLSNGLSFAGAEGAGLGPVMKTAEALFAEIAHLSTPSPIYPGISADGLEDIVTHAAIPAKNVFPIATRLRQLSAIEAIVAAQAIDLRNLTEPIAPALVPIYKHIRSVSEPLENDRPLGIEIESLALSIANGAFEL